MPATRATRVTARYRAVLDLAVAGYADAAIARHLGIGEAAVRGRWERLYPILGVPAGEWRRERALAIWSWWRGAARGG
jgi:DNA-binding NarL/FixJ family response regulator